MSSRGHGTTGLISGKARHSPGANLYIDVNGNLFALVVEFVSGIVVLSACHQIIK